MLSLARHVPGIVGLVAGALALASPTAGDAADTVALTGAKVYAAPDSSPIEDGVVQIRDGRIAALGRRSDVAIPAGARVSGCGGGVLTAGFYNSHVHFTGEAFAGARGKPAAALADALAAMLTRFGYTTVVDVASDRDNTLALRARIESGEVPGPRILTAGWPLFPPEGLPVYLAHLPRELLARLPQPATAEAALQVVRANLDAGAHGTKLFLVTPQGGGAVQRMPAGIAEAAADETHRRGRLVLAHPTDIEGVRAALAAGVDMLMHTTLGASSPWPESVLRRVVAADMAVVPTLKLLRYELKKERVPDEVAGHIVASTIEHFGAFVAAGGRVAFGTDVGYMADYDPAEEYALLAEAGLAPMQILAALTTVPATIWKESDRRGRLAVGMDADIVALEADPADDPLNFARVRCTLRRGVEIYSDTGTRQASVPGAAPCPGTPRPDPYPLACGSIALPRKR